VHRPTTCTGPRRDAHHCDVSRHRRLTRLDTVETPPSVLTHLSPIPWFETTRRAPSREVLA
jgi:hypothetical protein